MNERIQELIKQATILEDNDLFVREVFDPEKFAELIVRECVFISRTSANGFSAGDRMKEHFGVES